MKRTVLVFLVIAVATAVAFGTTYILVDKQNNNNEELEIHGVLIFQGIETGCWVIRTYDHKQYEPIQYEPIGIALDRKADNGKTITARGRIRNDLATACMSGIPFEILSYEKR